MSKLSIYKNRHKASVVNFEPKQNQSKQRVAVIGSGIAGLATAWLLKDYVDVRLYESSNRFGGHSHTVEVEPWVPVDTGFMVFNRPNYPLLSSFFDHLGIETLSTDMSFSVSLDDGGLEYCGTNLNTLFAQRSNILKPRFQGMLFDVLRFNRLAVAHSPDSGIRETLGEWLDRNRLGKSFRDNYLFPMAAAIWSCPRNAVPGFPVDRFLKFFINHGLVNLSGRPKWETPLFGSRRYVAAVLDDLGSRAINGSAVSKVRRVSSGVELQFENGHQEFFDSVVLACHADQALRILEAPKPSEHALLSAVPFSKNRVLLHSDSSLMPRRRSAWASWNFLGDVAGYEQQVSVTYWMNALQRLPTQTNYFVSLNPISEPAKGTVIREMTYEHPVFTDLSESVSDLLKGVQGRDRVWFCGAWTGYGFHEDGIRSATEVAHGMRIPVPWEEELRTSRELFEVGM